VTSSAIPTGRSDTARELAGQGKQADLLLGNNVLAHVPDLNDFVAGMKILLKDDGVITMEFPHLVRLIEWKQFDTIYPGTHIPIFPREDLADAPRYVRGWGGQFIVPIPELQVVA
jgi:hypothetical protein